MDSGNNAGPFVQGSFIKQQLGSPSLTFPADNQTLHFPSDPLLFTWGAVPGANSYTLQISNDVNFTSPSSYATVNTSYALTNTQAFTVNGLTQSYYWRVQATIGTQNSAWALPRSYQIDWAATPVLETPTNKTAPTDPDITDAVFSWDPVLGAASYQIQISPDMSFSSPTIDATVKSTRYAPPTTLNNGAYYWRVRAIASGTANNLGQWSAVYTFTRSWSTQPVIVPSLHADGGQNMELSWTPASASGPGWVDHADHYEVQISGSDTFPPAGLMTCTTNQTTLSLYTVLSVTGQSFSNPCSPKPGESHGRQHVLLARPRRGRHQGRRGPVGPGRASGKSAELHLQRIYALGYAARGLDIPAANYLSPECVRSRTPGVLCTPSVGGTQELVWQADPYATTYIVWVAKDRRLHQRVPEVQDTEHVADPTRGLGGQPGRRCLLLVRHPLH